MLKIGPHCLSLQWGFDWERYTDPKRYPPGYRVTWADVRAQGAADPGNEVDGLVKWVDKAPTLVKFVSFGKPDDNDHGLDDFRLANSVPSGPLVLAKPDEGFRLWQGEPAAQARLYFDAHFARNISTYKRVDIWEGPNEVTFRPGQTEPGVDDMLTWYAQFLREFARLVALAGKRAAIGSWATGVLSLDAAWLERYRPALDAVRDYNAVLSTHEYDVPGAYPWGWNNLRYRKHQAIWTQMGYGRLPVVITECGLDGVCEPDPEQSKAIRWKDYKYYYGDAGRYWREYCAVYNDALCADDYVLGATLYTYGNGCDPSKNDFNVSRTRFAWEIPDVVTPPAPPPIPEGKHDMIILTLDVTNEESKQVADILSDLSAWVASGKPVMEWTHTPPAPPAPVKHNFAPRTNQQAIQLFYRAFGASNGWIYVTKAGLRWLAEPDSNRALPYNGPDIEDLPGLSAADKAALVLAMNAK